MATITDTTTDANGNIIINVSSSADDAITLATAGTYSDKNIIFNIKTLQNSVQPDWNQNDDTQSDYVKNRPFYTGDPVETVFVEESTVAFADNFLFYMAEFPSTFEATVGDTYKVYWDGTAYERTCISVNNMPTIGNPSIAGAGSDTGEPFLMGIVNGSRIEIYTKDASASHTISISGSISEVIQIPDKYISDTFRDVIIARDPLRWSTDDWIKYYNLFKGGKLLKINSSRGSDFEGYVLSMFYHKTAGAQMSVIANEAFYTLSFDNTTQEFYWSPIFELDSLYFNYQKTGNDEEYCRLDGRNRELTYKTKTKAEGLVFRNVVLEGDKALVVTSSTAGSTKKFKITVDDSGTISATEVGAAS